MAPLYNKNGFSPILNMNDRTSFYEDEKRSILFEKSNFNNNKDEIFIFNKKSSYSKKKPFYIDFSYSKYKSNSNDIENNKENFFNFNKNKLKKINLLKIFSDVNKTTVQKIDEDQPQTLSILKNKQELLGAKISPVGENNFNINLIENNKEIFLNINTIKSNKSTTEIIMSEILEAFPEINISNENILEIFLDICKDQNGSRFIQERLMVWDYQIISLFFNKICIFSRELSTNLFGNYVIQKMIEVLDKEDFNKYIDQLNGNYYDLCRNMFGCRVVQKIIDKSDDIKFILKELKNKIFELINCSFGNHVIKKILEYSFNKKEDLIKNIPEKNKLNFYNDYKGEEQIIIKEIEKNTIEVCKSRYGGRIIQIIFENYNYQKLKKIRKNIIKNIHQIIDDQFGNYIVQYLIQDIFFREKIIDYITKNSFRLSLSKYSSNVVEKCVFSGTEKEINNFFLEFTRKSNENKPLIFYMCSDRYANYIVQTLYEKGTEIHKNKIIKIIKKNMSELKNSVYHKHLIYKISNKK